MAMNRTDIATLITLLCVFGVSVLAQPPDSEHLQMLRAAGPSADRDRQKLMVFGQFVGDWDFDMMIYEPNGTKRTDKGEWHFGWVLQGRAIQDVWMYPPLAEQAKGATVKEYGTTVRSYDPSLDAWHVVWIGPVASNLETFLARKVGDEIIMESQTSTDDARSRWIFSNITSDFFHWRASVSRDNGKTWKTEQEMFATRRK